MINKVKGKRRTVNRKSNLAWDTVITDLRVKLKDATDRAQRLQNAIDNFERLKQAGMPWPGSENVSGQSS